MSERDDFAAFVEEIGERIGKPVKCRKMHRPAFEFDGEWYPAYDEYEARSPRDANGKWRVWTFHVSLADLPREDAEDVVRWELEPL